MKGSLQITVSKDMMTATAAIYSDGVDEIDKAFVLNQIELLEINTGIDTDAIDLMLADDTYGREYVIARGKLPVPGKDGYYTFMFNVEGKNYSPTILEDGTVDYSFHRDLAKKGQLLAEYTPATAGHYGYTIFANVLAPIPPRELPPLQTFNVSKNENMYIATENGEIALRDNTISVIDVLNIDGNVSNVYGNVTFSGDIHVKGDVLTGTSVVCDGNIFIDGVVEGATLQAGKDIVIRSGVHGQGKCNISAHGSVTSHFIEEATVSAVTCIRCNYSCNSTLVSGDQIIAEGKHGMIYGGSATACNSIVVKQVGNEFGAVTSLAIRNPNGEIPQESLILVERTINDNCTLSFGDYVNINAQKNGEFHLVNKTVERFAPGKFVPTTATSYTILEQKKKTVLLVDDEPIILKTFYSYLSENYDVQAVTSAKDAFSLMEQTVPDLILLDYNMPKMNGGQMLEQMRHVTWKAYHNVPVIFATAVTDKSVILKCLSLYPQGYCVKPLSKEDLLTTVNNFFENQALVAVEPE